MRKLHFISWVPFRSVPNSTETRNSIPVGLELFLILSTYSLYVSLFRNYHQKQQYQLSLVVNIVINKAICHVVDHIRNNIQRWSPYILFLWVRNPNYIILELFNDRPTVLCVKYRLPFGKIGS